MKHIAYDFEVFRYFWSVVMINVDDTNDRVTIVNNPQELKEFYNKNKESIYIGFNSRNYDVWIFKAILSGIDNDNLFYISDQLIRGVKGYKLIKNESEYPIYNFDVSDKFRSLKELEGFMGSEIKESSVPFNLDRPLTEDEVKEVLKYNTHDVLETIKVLNHKKKTFEAQKLLIDAFSLPMSSYNKTNAMIAAEVLGAIKNQRMDDDFDLSFPDTLELPEKYKYILDWYKDPINKSYNKKLIANVAGVEHIFGWGGLHAAIPNYEYTCDENTVILSADVASLYPSLIIEYFLLSRNVTNPQLYKEIRDKRLVFKKEKNPIQEALKLVINTTYGAMKDVWNLLFDPLQASNVCVYGQLLLLDLISMVEPYCQIIQSNTDGIFMKVSRDNVELVKQIAHEWERRTRLNLEFDEFKSIWQKDVNNYLAVDMNGKIKSKGAYVKKLSAIDYDLAILNKALVNYLTKNITIEETINSSTDLIDFQKIVKIQGNYLYAIHNNTVLKEKVNRVFASKNPNDTAIYKIKNGDKKEKFANTPENLFIDNSDVTNKLIPDHLDKQWYIDFAKKRLNDFLHEKEEVSKEQKFHNLKTEITNHLLSYQTFYDFLVANKLLKISTTSELILQIKYGTFDRYAHSQKLLTFLEHFNLLYNKKSPKIKTTQEKITDPCILSIIENNSTPNETSYSKFDSENALKEIFDYIPNTDIHYSEKIKLQLEYDKTVTYFNPNVPIEHIYVVNPPHTMNNTLICGYCINNGMAQHLMIPKETFRILPCLEGDVIQVKAGSYELRNGKKIVGKNPQGINIIEDDPNNKKWWLTSYEIIHREQN